VSEIWSEILKEEQILRTFDSEVLKREYLAIPKEKKINGEWRKL
jgi:hypothetical protein